MAVTVPTYATREDVKRALDIQLTARANAQIDRAIEAAHSDVNGLCNRRFYNVDTTKFWDWPNFQRAYPWRIWFDGSELADVTTNVPVVTSGGVVIPAANIFWGPWNFAPPFTYLELNRSTSSSFGLGSTPQRDVAVTGTFGFWAKTLSAGTLATAMTDTTSTTITVTNGAAMGVGDVLICGTERMLAQDKAMIVTGVTYSGATTAKASDDVITVTDGTAFHPDEVLSIDAEYMLITGIIGNNLTVKRAWDGTVLATHSGAALYANRQLTVARGDFGTTAATHTVGSALTVAVVPGLVRELAVAEALVHLMQETSGYATNSGAAGAAGLAPGGTLPDLRDRCLTSFGRKARSLVV